MATIKQINYNNTVLSIDIKVKEPNLESMIKGKIKYDPPRFMTASQAAEQLLKIIEKSNSGTTVYNH